MAIALASNGVWAIGEGLVGRLGRLSSIGGAAMIGLGVQLAVTQRKD